MTGNNSAITGRVNRLRVFAHLKRVMTDEGRCPTAVEVARELGLSKNTTQGHMVGLAGATGLPMPIPAGLIRNKMAHTDVPMDEVTRALSGNRFLRDPGAPVPVDMLMERGT